jgi:predicted PolB exonuclease-like 3'-5' exonuclease
MRILQDLDLKSVLVIDIETVSEYPSYPLLPDNLKPLWDKKATQWTKLNDMETSDSVYHNAGLFGEFGKIVCISLGYFSKQHDDWILKVKSYANRDEKDLLLEFADLLNKYFYSDHFRFCAHNGKDFDLPFICRRMVINSIPLPGILDITGLKPWEQKHLDTMELWKFGDYKSATSLRLLAECLKIPSPKDDIDGSMVGKVFWEEDNLERISTYCAKDVVTTARVLMTFKGLSFVTDEQISITI